MSSINPGQPQFLQGSLMNQTPEKELVKNSVLPPTPTASRISDSFTPQRNILAVPSGQPDPLSQPPAINYDSNPSLTSAMQQLIGNTPAFQTLSPEALQQNPVLAKQLTGAMNQHDKELFFTLNKIRVSNDQFGNVSGGDPTKTGLIQTANLLEKYPSGNVNVDFNSKQSIENKMVSLGGLAAIGLLQSPAGSPQEAQAWNNLARNWPGTPKDLHTFALLKGIHDIDAQTGNLPPGQNPAASVRAQLVEQTKISLE